MKGETTKFKGLTKKKYKRQYGSSTPGNTKGENCRATGLNKALAKYPRAYKTMSDLYFSFNLKRDKVAKRTNTFFTRAQG